MPAEKHTRKADTPAKKRQWQHVAKSAESRGASRGSAIRQANAAVKEHPAKAGGSKTKKAAKKK